MADLLRELRQPVLVNQEGGFRRDVGAIFVAGKKV